MLCDCQPEHPTCQFTCLKTHTTAMDFCLVRGEGLAYLHPNALTASWELKQGAPLKSPDSQHTGYISGIITGALAASNPWCNSWGGQLLSISAWCQVMGGAVGGGDPPPPGDPGLLEGAEEIFWPKLTCAEGARENF